MQSPRFAARKLFRPGAPRCPLMDVTHYFKQDKIFQPPHRVALKFFKSAAVSVHAVQKMLCRLPQQRQLRCLDLVKIYAALEFWPGNAVFAQPAAFSQPLQADKQWIPGESR